MNKDKDKSKKKSEVLLNTLITIFTIAIIVLIGFLAYQYNKNKNSDENKLAYTDLVKEIQAGNVEKIEMTTGSMSLKVKMKDVEKEKTTIIPSVQVFSELVQQKVLEDNNIKIENIGIPDKFVEHGNVDELFETIGMSDEQIAQRIKNL